MTYRIDFSSKFQRALRKLQKLHLEGDFLLVYRIREQEKVLELLGLANHEELRKWR